VVLAKIILVLVGLLWDLGVKHEWLSNIISCTVALVLIFTAERSGQSRQTRNWRVAATRSPGPVALRETLGRAFPRVHVAGELTNALIFDLCAVNNRRERQKCIIPICGTALDQME
jgi:hypothetical protein